MRNKNVFKRQIIILPVNYFGNCLFFFKKKMGILDLNCEKLRLFFFSLLAM